MLPLALVIAVLHGAAAALLFVARPHWPMLLGFAGLAYALGVRHAFDADHIVAIDGTTRHLMAAGRNAVGVGFWFSLGHSSVVLLLALWVAHLTRIGSRAVSLLHTLAGGVGLAASATFMLLIAALNIVVLRDTVRAMRAPTEDSEVAAESSAQPGGITSRLFRRYVRVIRRPSQMYFVGLLFGLGLDTASEIALLAISATAAARDLPTGAVLVLPLAFAAGMSLADTLEGLFVARAYGWAHREPVRRARYNVIVTAFTVAAAIAVAFIELANAAPFGVELSPTAVGVAFVALVGVAWCAAAMGARLRRVSGEREVLSS